MNEVVVTCTACGSKDEYPASEDGSPRRYSCTGCSAPIVTGDQAPGTEVATVSAGTIAELLSARELPVLAWAKALLEMGDYQDSEQSDPGLEMIAAILGAETSAEALAATNMRSVIDLIGTDPGAHSPLLRITGAQPLRSSFDEGPSCFTVMSATVVATGEQFKLSCGGRAVQAVVLAHVNRGWLPFECIVTRRLKPTRAGFYPVNLEAGG